MTDTRQDGWVYFTESGRPVYRASSLGGCIRSLTAARLGESAMRPNAGLRAAMEASSSLESEIVRRVETELGDGKVIWQQKRVELLVELTKGPIIADLGGPVDNKDSMTVIIRGHIDGLHQQSDSIIEIKALGPANFKKYNEGGGLPALGKLGEKYAMQAAVYGHATNRKVRFVIGEKVKVSERTGPGGIGEENEVTGWDIDRLIIEPAVSPESLVPLTDIYDRIRTIEDYASRDELPECTSGCREGDPYGEVHIFAPVNQGDDDLEVLLSEYDSVVSAIKNLEDEKGSLRERLIEEYGPGKYAAGIFSARIEKVKSSRFDVSWVKKSHPDIYDQGLVPSESVRVTVTRPKVKDDL